VLAERRDEVRVKGHRVTDFPEFPRTLRGLLGETLFETSAAGAEKPQVERSFWEWS
jgi:hypothetical protein